MSRVSVLSLILLITVTLGGCGGGGGGGGSGGSGGSGGGGNAGGGVTITGISLSPSTMSFTANHDDPDAPPAQTVTITALGTGTTYIRFENGVSTGLTCNGTSSCTYSVRPTSPPSSFVSPGMTTDAITFIGCADQTCTTGAVANGRQTLTYTYTITPGLDIAPGGPLNVTAVEGVPPPPQTLTLTHPSGTVPPWQATFVPTGAGSAFVTLSPALAAAQNSTTLQAQFASLPAGTYTGTIEVQPGTSPRRVRRDVTYTVQSALSVPDVLSFTIDTAATSLQQTVTVAASPGAAGSLQWTATESSPWLDLSRTSGDTVAGNQIVVSLVRADIERMPKGIHTADITFRPPNLVPPFDFTTRTLRVVLDMRLPHTAFVMPRAVAEGSTGEAFVRGSGLASLPGTVKFGSTDAAPPATLDNDTLIRASYPATLSSGNYKVDLSVPANAAGLNREHARLTVLSPTALQSAAADIAVPAGQKYAAVFDDARLALYVANVVDTSPTAASTIQRLVWNAGSNSWILDELPVALLRDLTLSPGGDELLALTSSTITRIDPNVWSVTGTVNTSPFALAKRSVAVGNDGRLTISESEGGGTYSHVLYYDLSDGSSASEFVPGVSGNIRASGDGTVLYLVGGNMRRYDVKTRTYTDNSPVGGAQGDVLSVSRTGARFIVDGTIVYRSDFTKLGTLPAPSGEIFSAAAITPDGTRAYAYGASGKLYGFQLDLFNGADFAPVPGTPVTLPHTVDSPVMTTSADGRAVFIAGNDRVIVKPVGP